MVVPPSTQTSAYAKQLLADRNRQNNTLRTPPRSVPQSPIPQNRQPPEPRLDVPEIRPPSTLSQPKPTIGPTKINTSAMHTGSLSTVNTPQIQNIVKPEMRISSIEPKIYERPRVISKVILPSELPSNASLSVKPPMTPSTLQAKQVLRERDIASQRQEFGGDFIGGMTTFGSEVVDNIPNVPKFTPNPIRDFPNDVVKGAGMAFNSMDPRPIFDSKIAASKPKSESSNALIDSWIKGTLRGDINPALRETMSRVKNNPGRIVGEVAVNAGVFITTGGVGNMLGKAAAGLVKSSKDVAGSATLIRPTKDIPATLKAQSSKAIVERNLANAKKSGVNVERLPSASQAIKSRKFMSNTVSGVGRSAEGDETIATALGQIPESKVMFGSRTPTDLKRMTEFSKFVSENHRGKTYPRGSVATSYDPSIASKLAAVGVSSVVGATSFGAQSANAVPFEGKNKKVVKTKVILSGPYRAPKPVPKPPTRKINKNENTTFGFELYDWRKKK